VDNTQITESLPSDHAERMRRAGLALDGLSIGDGFGAELCWQTEDIPPRRLPGAPWRWTDDTEMALSIVRVLGRFGRIEQDALARSFAEHFDAGRMYGPAMYHELLPRLKRGDDWRTAAPALFDGGGSLGNGAAMRVAPLGAYFADELPRVVDEAKRSAEVTHGHPEGIAGAIAIAAATARAWHLRATDCPRDALDFIEPLLTYMSDSHVRREIETACRLPPDVPVEEAAQILGNGSRVTARDTVPLALWLSARFMTSYEDAMWNTAGAFGDMDTNCAIVGGIVAMYVGRGGLPAIWLKQREPLPYWPFLSDGGKVGA
jgi:ADP-ribosylglycohydrolase